LVKEFAVGAEGTTLRQPIAILASLLGLGAGTAMWPLTAIAEISNDLLLGPGLRSRPAYDGSASQRLELVPVIRYFGQPWFIRTTQGPLEAGARTEVLSGLHGGAQLAYEPGRQTGESKFLQDRRVASLQRGASLGLQLEWDHRFGPMPITALIRIRKHTDAHLGTQADIRLSAGVLQSGRFGAGVFTQAIWADGKSTAALYGIEPQQSALTGLPSFEPGSGWLNVSLGLLWSFNLGPKWVVVGSLESRRLRGDAAQSPLAERSSNRYLSAGLAHRY
jgi:outer membrane scaffolding protein for murein synthesis (MipA/OmpV family)